jgi:hypothetical protein
MRPPLTVLAFALSAAACSSSSSVPGADSGANVDGSGDVAPRVPADHRAAAAACPSDRPAGDATAPGGKCTKDADCTSGKNGRCLAPRPPDLVENTCSYDDCFTDADCGSGVCACRSATHHGANTCFHANCRTDADCAGRGCSPSAVATDPSCQSGLAIGSFGYFCHTASDECIDDGDCGGSGPSGPKICIFDADVAHWRCFATSCTF